ncbi:MAG: hypothetical protein ACHP84_10075 [Caulobacterales bacterium]|jgi:hypothetical protein
MPKGNELGVFSAQSTSVTYLPGPAGSTLVQANFEGTGTGFGTIGGTATFVGGKSGTLSWDGGAYLDNGDQVSGHGAGTYESVGTHRWRIQLITQISDGSAVMSDGELDLATRTWSGKLFEWK